MRTIKLFGLRIFPCDLRIDYQDKEYIEYSLRCSEGKRLLLCNHDWRNLKGREGIKRRIIIYIWRFVIVGDFVWRIGCLKKNYEKKKKDEFIGYEDNHYKAMKLSIKENDAPLNIKLNKE